MLEKLGVPMAVHLTTTFAGLGKAEMAAEGLPSYSVVVFPHPLAGLSREAIRKQVEGGVDKVIKALTTNPEKSDDAQKVAAGAIQIGGKDYAEAFEKFNEYFLERHWGDGLPLVPPTRDKVDWMLSGTDRSPNDVIVTTRPSGRALTVEALAINAVMAGAKPAFMPVITAALKAFDRIPWGWGSVTTTSSVAPLVCVNGPIAKQLDINSKNNALGYGWRANATIGRTIEMVFHCVGGAVPGVTDMSTLGYPTTFTSTVFAEDVDVLDDIGWTTFAEDKGFGREENVASVTVIMGGYKIIFHYEATNAEEGMKYLLWTAKPMNFVLPQGAMFMLNPEYAKVFASSGWKRADLMHQIALRGSEKWKVPIKEAVSVIDWTKSWRVGEAGPKWFKDLPEDFPLPVWPREAKDIWLFVAGGSGKESHFYPHLKGYTDIQSEKIELPANWDKIVRESDIRQTLTAKLPRVPW